MLTLKEQTLREFILVFNSNQSIYQSTDNREQIFNAEVS